ncbi:MAG: Ig-like domain-containing protein, partial [Bacteroidia bacterium]|nr:Ig-like domain-containing protein [Bacteroidia bacterium]
MEKKCIAFLFVLMFGFLFKPNQAKAQLETIPTGSYIIDMGIVPQTIGNGLKPYGLAYHLVRFENVPIKWSINPNKVKDGTDFIYNGYEFKGGPFIIPANFRNTKIDSIISAWNTLGVVGVTTTSDINVPVYRTLTFFPTWTLDDGSGGKVIPYFGNSGIPADAYKFNETQLLNCCDDVFILPHSDPTWGTHSNLFYWNAAIADGGCEGWIWSACHGVSVLEAIVGPGGEKMNFLSNDPGTVDFGDHDGGTMPYSYDHPTEPFMQFMDILDGATENGSEQIYLPITTWRPSTKIGVYDPDHPDVPSLSQGPAAKVAFGHAFGDVNRGQVMFEGGHSHDNGAESELVAAQRVFFNFCFLAPAKSTPEITSHNIPLVVQSGEVLNLTATATAASTAGVTYEWFDVCGGSFNNAYIQSPIYTAPIVTEATPCGITVRATDECGRVGFLSQEVTVVPAPEPPVANADNDTTPPYLPVDVDVLDNDTDINLDPLTVTGFVGSPTIPGEGTFSINPDGTVRFTPDPTFTGTSSIDYIVCDTTSRCDTGTVSILVAYPDSDGDGITDDVDVDDDNDGILDTDYYGGTDPSADDDND